MPIFRLAYSTMHSLHLLAAEGTAEECRPLVAAAERAAVEECCFFLLCTCTCHCIHFQMPITAFTQQQCVCEGKYAACAGPQEKNAKKKGGGLPIRQRRIGASTLIIPYLPIFDMHSFWGTIRDKNHSNKQSLSSIWHRHHHAAPSTQHRQGAALVVRIRAY